MPIRTLEIIDCDILGVDGYRNSYNFVTDKDLGPITNPSGHAKIKRIYESCPDIFNFYILTNAPKSCSFARELPPGILISSRPNEITVVYSNNITNRKNWIPFTAWILAHRLHHALSCKGQIDTIEFSLSRMLIDILECFVITEKDSNRIVNDRAWHSRIYSRELMNSPIIECYSKVLHKFLTMRSARMNRLNTIDISPEIFAQYIIAKSVRFNPINIIDIDPVIQNIVRYFHPDIRGYELLPTIQKYSNITKNPNFLSTVQQILDRHTILINAACQETMDACKGKVLTL
jgi:hypothetical protein